jgi:phosphoadenosine phosphosulfate reductase
MQSSELTAELAIQDALGNAPDRACLTCSFQAEDMVALHLARQIFPDIAVLFLDTGYHFAETVAYRDRMTEQWKLNLVNLRNEKPLDHLYRTDPTGCCNLRKVEPLFRGLSLYDAWITGLRREQSPTRANLKKLETHILPDGRPIRKISPLADWTWKDVWSYITINEIETLPLYDRGYVSIGCEPCTALPADPDNPRSGRWGGAKLECGIHTFSKQEAAS